MIITLCACYYYHFFVLEQPKNMDGPRNNYNFSFRSIIFFLSASRIRALEFPVYFALNRWTSLKWSCGRKCCCVVKWTEMNEERSMWDDNWRGGWKLRKLNAWRWSSLMDSAGKSPIHTSTEILSEDRILLGKKSALIKWIHNNNDYCLL